MWVLSILHKLNSLGCNGIKKALDIHLGYIRSLPLDGSKILYQSLQAKGNLEYKMTLFYYLIAGSLVALCVVQPVINTSAKICFIFHIKWYNAAYESLAPKLL